MISSETAQQRARNIALEYVDRIIGEVKAFLPPDPEGRHRNAGLQVTQSMLLALRERCGDHMPDAVEGLAMALGVFGAQLDISDKLMEIVVYGMLKGIAACPVAEKPRGHA